MKSIPYRNFSLICHQKNWRQKRPNVCHFELTFKCDLHCKHCYSDCYNKYNFIQEELNTQEIRVILDQAFRLGALWLCFSGGDPLARQDFLEVYDYAKSKGFIITIFTNAYSMDERIIGVLEKSPPFLIEITLNAATRELFEEISQVKGSFSKVMNGIDLIMKAKLPLKIKTDAMKYNREELPKIKKFVQGLGLKFTLNNLLHSRLDGNLTPVNLRVSPQEARLRKIDKNFQTDNCELSGSHSAVGTNRSLFSCSVPKGDGIHIDPYGNLLPCICIRKPKVNLLNEDMDYAYKKIIAWVKTVHSTADSACADCFLRDICRNCPGKALLETGKLEERVNWFCELAHLEHARLKK